RVLSPSSSALVSSSVNFLLFSDSLRPMRSGPNFNWYVTFGMSNGVDLKGLFAAGNSYCLTRFVILRLLGFVYAVAFLVAAQQLVPLVGEHGLTPANHFFERV